MDIAIQHDPANQKFFVLINGEESSLTYAKIDNKTLDYQRTFVPVSLRGERIGENLVRFALDYARLNKYKIIPTCPFIKRFIDRHPEYKELMV